MKYSRHEGNDAVTTADLALARTTITMLRLLLIVCVLALLVISCDAFAPPSSPLIVAALSSFALKVNGGGGGNDNLNSNNNNNMVVISPPGGLGEMTAIESAKLGGNVKWFIVSPPFAGSSSSSSSSTNVNDDGSIRVKNKKQTTTMAAVSIAAETMSCIRSSGGSLDFAGACITDLQSSSESSSSTNEALNAMGAWCNRCYLRWYQCCNCQIIF
jgi:hypothetical protein